MHIVVPQQMPLKRKAKFHQRFFTQYNSDIFCITFWPEAYTIKHFTAAMCVPLCIKLVTAIVNINAPRYDDDLLDIPARK